MTNKVSAFVLPLSEIVIPLRRLLCFVLESLSTEFLLLRLFDIKRAIFGTQYFGSFSRGSSKLSIKDSFIELAFEFIKTLVLRTKWPDQRPRQP